MKYNYQDLKEKALKGGKQDRLNLWNWFEENDRRSWNGECYDADEFLLYPVYDFTFDDDGEIESFDIIDAEIRY